MNRRGGGGGSTVRKGRAPCCDKTKVKRGPWSPAEDAILVSFIQKHGHPNWRSLPQNAGLLRCGKSCRLRWINYLRPDVKRGNFSPEEEETIIRMHKSIGNKWSIIAAQLPGRTDNEIKNVWNTHLKKKLANHHSHSQSPHRESSAGSPSSASTTSTSSCISNSNSNGDLMIMSNFDNKDDQNNQVVENEEDEEEEEEGKGAVSPSDGDFEFWRWFESLKDCNEEGGEIGGGEEEEEEERNEHEKEEEREKMGVGEELKQWLKQLENELELF